jgi:hypothetical protein
MKCREVRIYLRKRNGSLDNGEGYEVACPELQLTFRQERRSSDSNQTPAFTIWMIGAGLEHLGAGYDVTLNLALAI